MSAKISKRERLMNLVSALLAAREPLAFREIIGRVIGYDDPGANEALEKRFDRDKTDLRRLGIPIDYVASDDQEMKAGYVIRPERVFQQKVTFTPQETVLLAIAGRIGAAATGGGALEEALKSALRKLSVDLPGLDPLDEAAEVSVLRARSGDPRTLANVSALAQAVTAGRRVEFDYAGLHDEAPGTRLVDPYGLGLVRGEWFVVGFCHVREGIRVFKASRIAGSVVARESTEGCAARVGPPPGFRIEEHLGQEIWNFGDGVPVPVKLGVSSFTASATSAASAGKAGGINSAGGASDILALLGALSGGRVLGEEGGRTVIEIEVRRPMALVPWILSQAGRVVVLEPATLRKEVVATARRVLDRALEARLMTVRGASSLPESRFESGPVPDPEPDTDPESALEPQLLDIEGEAS